MNLRTIAAAGHFQNILLQLLAREKGSLPADESLPRRGSLAAIGSDVRVTGKKIEFLERRAQSLGADLRNDRGGALADVHGALMQSDAAVAFKSNAHGRRIGKRSVAAAVPHTGDADSAAERIM